MADNTLAPFAFIETPEQARERTSLRADLADSRGGADFLATLIGRGMQAARGRGPQKRAVEQAEAVQGALQRALAQAGFDGTDKGMSAVDANSHFLVNAVQELNSIGRPDLALQFAQQLGSAEQDRVEVRRSLLAGDAQQLKNEEFEDTAAGRTAFGLQDPESGDIEGPFVLSTDEGKQEFRKARLQAKAEGRTLLPVSADALAKLSADERIAAMRAKNAATRGGSNLEFKRVPFRQFYSQAVGALGVLGTINDMANVVKADTAAGAPNATGETVRGFMNNLGFQARSFLRTNPAITSDEYKQMDEMAHDTIRSSGLRQSQFQSLAYDLAYALARARDPNGRLSDFDVELAIKTTQASQADPGLLLSTLAMIARRSARNALDASTGLDDIPSVQEMIDKINKRVDAANSALGSTIDLGTPGDLVKYLNSHYTSDGRVRRQQQEQPTKKGPRIVGIRRKE